MAIVRSADNYVVEFARLLQFNALSDKGVDDAGLTHTGDRRYAEHRGIDVILNWNSSDSGVFAAACGWADVENGETVTACNQSACNLCWREIPKAFHC